MNPLEQSWYPSCVIVLTIRFDEAMQVAGTGDKITAQALAAQTQHDRIGGDTITLTAGGKRTLGNKKHRARRALTEQPDAARQANNAALSTLDQFRPQPASQYSIPGTDPTSTPGGSKSKTVPTSEVAPLTFGTDGFTVIANRVPKHGSFTLPHPRSAGTFNVSFDFHEFPVDPRLIRAVGIECHIGAVSAEDYGRGMAGEKDSDGRPLSILKTTTGIIDPWSGRPAVNDATLLFHATADTWEVDHSEKGSSIVIEGRDIRGIFIDQKAVSAKVAKLDLTKPIDQVIHDLISTMGIDNDLRMSVVTNAAEWPNGKVPSPGDADGLTRVRQGASGERTDSTPQTSTKTSYWDLITNYCTLVGAMPVFVGSMLWIRPSRSIFDILAKNSQISTPFQGGVARAVGTEKLRVRRMVYGRDLKTLKFARKFAGAVVPTIQVFSFDDRATGMNRLLFGQWPPAISDQAQSKAENELLRIPVYGVRSVDQLTKIAEGIYEEIGRGETGGSAETSDLASFGGDNTDPDLLRMRPLEPVEFVVDKTALRRVAPVVAELIDNERRSFAEEVQALTDRLGDRAVARALVALARGAVQELLSFYQVISCQFDWDGGLKTQFAFQNYIVPRQQVSTQTSSETRPQTSRVNVVGAQRKKHVATTGNATSEAFPIQDQSNPYTGNSDGIGQGANESSPPDANSPRLFRRYRRLGDATPNSSGDGGTGSSSR